MLIACAIGLGLTMLPAPALAEEELASLQDESTVQATAESLDVVEDPLSADGMTDASDEAIASAYAEADIDDSCDAAAVDVDDFVPAEDEQVPQMVGEQEADEQASATVPEDEALASDVEVLPDDDQELTDASDNPPALPEGSQEVEEGTYVLEAGIAAADKTGLAGHVLDAQGGVRDGAKVITWSYTGKDNQKWYIAKANDGWYTIMPDSDRTLALTATRDKARLYLTPLVEGLASQLWAFVINSMSYGNGYQLLPQGVQTSKTKTTIVPADNTKALDVRGGKPEKGSEVITYTRSTAPKANQSFYLAKPIPEVVTGSDKTLEGKYRVKVPGTKVVLEIRKATDANGANVWLYDQSGKAHQDVYLQHEGNGFYSVWIMGTKKVLDVRGSSILPGANVIQWAYKGTDNQLWAVRKNSDGTFTFVNKATGLVLGAASEAAGKSGTNLTGAQDNGRANNLFEMVRSALLSPGIYKIKEANSSKVLDVNGASTANGAKLSFYTDKNSQNQRFELVNGGGTDLWRIRTASSGGWINYAGSQARPLQQGNHATPASENDTWHIVWREGNYMITSVIDGKVLGGGTKKVTFTKAAIPLKTGLVEIDGKLSGVAIDLPKSSTESGTKINVYKDNNGDNQKFFIEKSGSGYKIISFVSEFALTASGNNIVQKSFTGADTQIWTVAIADAGYVKLVNKSTGKVLDITGSSTVSNTKSTALQVSSNTADRESRQSWRVVQSVGWYKKDGHWYYQSDKSNARYDKDIDTHGNSLGHYDVLHDIWEGIKNKTSKTKYLIASSWDACYVGIFVGKQGSWQPILGFNCANGSKSLINSKVRLENPESTWYWNPYWEYQLALSNQKKNLTKERASAWTGKLDSTWSGSRLRKVNNEEQYFTSIKWELGYHTYLKSKSELGKHVSNGCQRLEYRNAQWIYENIGPGTRCIQMKTRAYA